MRFNAPLKICAICKHACDENVINNDFVYCKKHKIEVKKGKRGSDCSHFCSRQIKNKFNSTKYMIDGIKFDSKKEAHRYVALKLLQKGGKILWFIRQPSFDLGAGLKYKADFLIVWADGKTTIEDVKGYRTKEFIRSKKLVEDKYPIEIEEI